MGHPVWKGAISFGLVHIPVEMYPASKATGIDLDLLDKRDFSPIGYKRYNKVTGKLIKPTEIVKGYQYEKGKYVVLSDEDIKHANIQSTQTIDILSFTDSTDISPIYFDQPYYLTPAKGGERVYRLLRETLKKSNKSGLAHIVIRTKQHLAALLPEDEIIILNLLRYEEEIRPLPALKEIDPKKQADISTKEIKMALSLVNEMSEAWNPQKYRDTFRKDLLKMIKTKIKHHQTHTLNTLSSDVPTPATSSNVVDLMVLLKNSIGQKNKNSPADKLRKKA